MKSKCKICGKTLIKDLAFISGWGHEEYRNTVPCQESWARSQGRRGYDITFLLKSEYFQARFKEEDQSKEEKKILREVVVWKH